MSRKIAIIGNPNSGKTTVFNGLTGGSQRVGNWPGVTVEKKVGRVPIVAPSLAMVTGTRSTATTVAPPKASIPTERQELELVDLPGIYSFAANSEDELVALDYLRSGDYDLVVNIVDSANLERNLFLTLQLIEMRVPLLVVLTMSDIAKNQGVSVDTAHLAHHLDCPVVQIQATRRDGIETVRRAIVDRLLEPSLSAVSVSYPDFVQDQIAVWETRLQTAAPELGLHPGYTAGRLLEGDPWIETRVLQLGLIERDELEAARVGVSKAAGEALDIVFADARYGYIHGLSRDVITRRPTRESVTERVDRVAMSRALGIPIFLAAMYLVFAATVSFGGAFIDFFDIAFGTIFVDGLGTLLATVGSPEWLIGVVAGGIGAGIQTVATFVPIIFMMFLCLSILEDSGYMARAAFVMDRLMRWVGLPGKSFVPMLVGFGCTVPAISATRTLESRKDRYLTMFMAPFMSCGARLPVYALFAAAMFSRSAGLLVFGLYLIGLVLAIGTGLLLKNTIFRGEYSHFVMELPPYHLPRLGKVLGLAWRRLRVFIWRAGATITIVVTVLAVLNSLGTDGSFGNEDGEDSVLSAIGRTVTPVFAPMGIEQDNWPATVGLFTGLFAKEAVVGTLGALYTQDQAVGAEAEEGQFDFWGGLGEAFASIPDNLSGLGGALTDPLGTGIVGVEADELAEEFETSRGLFTQVRERFSPAAAFAYLVFVLIYFPCVAALGAAIQEMGRGYGWLLAGYLTALAWVVATLIYQFGSGSPALLPVLGACAGVIAIFVGFHVLGRVLRSRGTAVT